MKGKREGVSKTYDSSGVLTTESNYKDNKLSGNLILYTEAGEVKSVKRFIDDKEVK